MSIFSYHLTSIMLTSLLIPTCGQVELVDFNSQSATKGCGAYCVAIVAGLAGMGGVSYESAELATDPDGDGVSSVADLVLSLRALGLEAIALNSAAKTLPDGLSILHVRSSPKRSQPDHFIVAESVAPGQYRYYVPPDGSGLGDGDVVSSLWEGDYVQLVLEEDRSESIEVLLVALGSSLVAAAFVCWRKFRAVPA